MTFLLAYLVGSSLTAVAIGRMFRRNDEADDLFDLAASVGGTDHTRPSDPVVAAAFERIGDFGCADEEDWERELFHTDDEWTATGAIVAAYALAQMPMPRFQGEDHV